MTAAAGAAEWRCAQCWRMRPLGYFVGARGGLVQRCAACRKKYAGWQNMSLAERAAARGPRKDEPATGRMIWNRRSGNSKLGPIPASMSEPGTCPVTCAFYEAGCYAMYGKAGAHWRAVGRRGISWDEFLARVRALPAGQLWRHNVAGDLRHGEGLIDLPRLTALVLANERSGARGFTFTHHRPEMLHERAALAVANDRGFTINLSADSLEEADELAGWGVGPVVVTLPEDAPKKLKTPAGRSVVVCPAQTSDLTCAECELCSKPRRKSIVGFRAHGQFKALVTELVKTKREGKVAEGS